MSALQVQVGSTITNGSSCIRVTERVEKDPCWGCPSWRGINIPLEQFGGNPGTTSSVPDYLLSGWYHVPFEWRPVIGGGLEERYIWASDWRHLKREVRRVPGVMPTVDGIRGHPITSAQEDETIRSLAEMLAELTPTSKFLGLPPVCEIPDCGCSGEAHA